MGGEKRRPKAQIFPKSTGGARGRLTQTKGGNKGGGAFYQRIFPLMKTSAFSRLLLVAAGIGGLLLSGCSSVPLDESGEKTAVNNLGEFGMVANADLKRTLDATRAALAEMRLTETSADVRTFDADLVAETELNEKIRIKIREINSRQTEVGIRVKWTGHQEYSKRLWQRIEAHLGGS